tara:strand:+ start:17181 stop:17390 length:210 start_codon:yes stop_codon:yes gene_type:complete
MDKIRDTEKIICVIEKFPKFLTYEKQYEAIRSLNYYHVVNDAGQTRKYKGEYFMTIDEYREKVLNELGI